MTKVSKSMIINLQIQPSIHSALEALVKTTPSCRYFLSPRSCSAYLYCEVMERRNETEKPVGICQKLFNYLVKSFPLYKLKQISQGRQDRVVIRTTRGPERVPALDVAVEKRKDEAATTKEPGIHGTTFIEVTKGSQKSVSFREDVEENDAVQTKPGRSKEKEPKKKPSVAQQQESKPQVTVLRPKKPIIKAISNIDEKSGRFIQKRRESFAS